ncbi:MAG TPA: hypothetical protein PKW05_09330 [Anaerolineae bacterium]|nr:hypothetical protein [Anaerolineae bacterium]
MKRLSFVLEYVVVTVLYLSVQVLGATLLWNWFAPQMLGVPRANPLQMALALLFYMVFTGKFWRDVADLLDRRARKRSQTQKVE